MNARLDRLRGMREWIDGEIEAELKLMGAPLGSDSLIARAAALYGVAPADIIGDGRRDRHVAKARQAACWLLREAGMTYPRIAVILGYADHTTALYACRKVDATPAVRSLLQGIRKVAA